MFPDTGYTQIRLGMLPMRTGWKGTRQIGWGLSHFEPPKSQPTLESKSGWCANMFLDKGFIDQIRCCLCERDGREPCRTMQNHADMWGLSHSKSS